MPYLEFTLVAEVAEETLDEAREAMNAGEFGAEQAMLILHDANPGVALLKVTDENR